ncbi:MAG: hypothetical protein RBU37_09885 [Myxococcota bacterium]|nr:hypothetical protein [Myxococcota bacterium]
MLKPEGATDAACVVSPQSAPGKAHERVRVNDAVTPTGGEIRVLRRR